MTAAPEPFLADWRAREARATELAAKEDWRALDRATRAMLSALLAFRGDTLGGRPRRAIEVELWRSLRRIHEERLPDLPNAIVAAAEIARLVPDDGAERLVLGALRRRAGDLAGAVAAYETALTHAPSRHDAMRALLDVHLEAKASDRAWCVASALAFEGALPDAHRAFYEARRARRLPRLAGKLDRAAWATFARREPNPAMTELFTRVAHLEWRWRTRGHETPKAMRDPRLRPAALAARAFRPAFAYALDTLGLPAQEHVLAVAGAEAPALEPGADLDAAADGFGLREILFVAGRHAAFHRPWHLLLLSIPREVRELVGSFWGGIVLAHPNTAPPPIAAEITREVVVRLRGVMTPALEGPLREAVDRVVATTKLDATSAWSTELYEWRTAQELTSARAGLLLSGDLDVAKKMLAAEPAIELGVPLADAMADLVVFAASGAYARARRRLGLGEES